MVQEQVNIEGAQWLSELRAVLDDRLVDVRYATQGDGYDFLLIHAPENRRAAIERFTEAFTRAKDIPPFEIMCFEQDHVPDYYGDYVSIGPSPSRAS